eukprot:TRINITY_DN5582_c0_g1_i1.p1 TRINITY_DN5582_c0_g1~~TRINITY_DN5582_c0_g1_i1.p1  ORF type:complete len:173 (+),score=46.59 TRINITY_DN5582_c0_g1_i1:221-739(+)
MAESPQESACDYGWVASEMHSVVEESDLIAQCANASAVLFHFLNQHKNHSINWCGFYFVRGPPDRQQLVLGPFQGKRACTRIAKSAGVCGTSWASASTQVVPDVHAFPGHIACDAASQSEVVVPVIVRDEVVALLDIDSNQRGTFSEEDGRGLEKVAAVLAERGSWCQLTGS